MSFKHFSKSHLLIICLELTIGISLMSLGILLNTFNYDKAMFTTQIMCRIVERLT